MTKAPKLIRRLRGWTLALLFAGSASAGIWYLSRPDPVLVALAEVSLGRVDATVANTRAGTVKACRRALLAPATGGQVAELPVKEGERVETGQVLMTIWNEDLKARVRLAQSEAAAARARSEEACLRAEVAQREARRLERLREQLAVSEERVDRAVTDAKASQAACRAAAAAAQVSEAQVAVAQAELARTILRAPFPGVIAEVNGELGEFITPSPPGIPTPPAVDIIDDSCLYVSAPIDEVDAAELRTEMPARVSLDAFPGRRWSGRLRRIAPYVQDWERQARTVDVEVEFTDPAETENLLVGYSADVEIVLDAKERTLRIPTEAVMEGYRVLVLDETTGRLAERRFEAGLANWQYTEVLSGLQAGEQVVTSIAREGVKTGARARPEPTGDGGSSPS
jgi:HlyD family secretion protein